MPELRETRAYLQMQAVEWQARLLAPHIALSLLPSLATHASGSQMCHAGVHGRTDQAGNRIRAAGRRPI